MLVDRKTGFRTLRAIVLSDPDRVDPDALLAQKELGEGCVYARREGRQLTPSCVVGHWVSRVGGDLAPLDGLNERANEAVPKAGIDTDEKMLAVLEGVQLFQDRAVSWREALTYTLEAYALALRFHRQSRDGVDGSWPVTFARAVDEVGTRHGVSW